MKRILSVFIAAMLVLVVCFAFPGCGSEPPAQTGGSQQGGGTEYGENGSVLVAYFSNTGNTEGVAEHIAEATGGDLREIVPEVPYTSADLDYGDDDSRANVEQNDPEARPEISGGAWDLSGYERVFIGYPIWWGDAPRIIQTFIESNDLSGKTVYVFSTSGSSSGNGAYSALSEDYPDVDFGGNIHFTSSQLSDAEARVSEWISGLDLPENDDAEVTTMYIKVNGNTLPVTMEDNASAREFTERLRSGDVTVTMNDYGDMEKVGPLGFSVTRSDTRISVGPGDVILYQGDQITVYYDESSWTFTRLGHVNGVSTRERMLELLGGVGSVTMTFTLEK